MERYQQAADLLQELQTYLRNEWPPELPDENSSEMWTEALRLEPIHRRDVSNLIEQFLSGIPPRTLSPLQTWFVTRRFEFAGPALLATAKTGKLLPSGWTPNETCRLYLIDLWNDVGAAKFRRVALQRIPGG